MDGDWSTDRQGLCGKALRQTQDSESIKRGVVRGHRATEPALALDCTTEPGAMPLLELVLLVLLVVIGEGEPVCRLQGRAELPELAKDGDLVIGGIFTFQTEYDSRVPNFQSLPDLPRCKK